MWRSKISQAWRRWFATPTAESEEPVDEELMFHLRSLIDENLAKGMPADAAWHEAQTRFGSLRRYADECRRVFERGRFMTQKLAVAGLLLLGVLMGWAAIEVRALRQTEAHVLRLAQWHVEDRQVVAERCDLQGLVVDRSGKPLAGAHVLVALKTWPGGCYREDDIATTSDGQGRFRLAKLLPTVGHREVLVAAVKDGHALTSTYEAKWAGEPLAGEPIVLKLEDAADFTVLVHDRAGRPAAHARVVPTFRRTASGEEHLVYLQASKPIRTVSDDGGRAALGCFQRGDEAEVWIQVPGGDWERRAITVPDDGEAITVSSDELALQTGGEATEVSKTGSGRSAGAKAEGTREQ